MSSETEVYRLRQVLDNPRFEGFYWDLPGLTNKHGRDYDFTNFSFETKDYEIPRLKELWDSPQVLGEEAVSPYNDYPCCGFRIPAFSVRAVGVLREFLENNGEILPLTTKRSSYFAYQTLTVADDVLNCKQTTGMRVRNDSGMFRDISKYTFFKTKLKGLSIFRIREEPSRILVTSVFKRRAESAGLLGFWFDKIWPQPSTSEIKEEKARQARNRRVRVENLWKDYQAETLVLHFPIKSTTLRKSEQSAIEGIRVLIDDFLAPRSIDAEFFGSTAGYEMDGRSYRLLLPCPDARRLLARLTDLLTSVEWPAKFKVSRRSTPYWDQNAEDEWIDL